MLRAADCDLVALQEVSEAQGPVLDRELGSSYPHSVIRANGLAGKALFSKHPVSDPQDLLLDCGRPHLAANVDFDGRALHVIIAHLPLEHAVVSLVGPARREIDSLASLAMGFAPSLLLGDFNKTPFSFLYRRLRRLGLEDAFQKAGSGSGFTFPVFGRYKRIPLPPLVRIDYIWHTPDVEAIGCRTGPDGGSDHLPVLAELEIPAVR
jgi:endonuclease/exonuclease/phosphatase (EEP) superfamily protein YafD